MRNCVGGFRLTRTKILGYNVSGFSTTVSRVEVYFYFGRISMKAGKDVDLEERVRLKKADRAELYSLEPPFPTTNFLMELSSICNHACIFCAHQKMKRKVSKIDKALGFDILKQAYDLGTREVGFYATGEPFLVPELPEYIRKAKSIGYSYVLHQTDRSRRPKKFVR